MFKKSDLFVKLTESLLTVQKPQSTRKEEVHVTQKPDQQTTSQQMIQSTLANVSKAKPNATPAKVIESKVVTPAKIIIPQPKAVITPSKSPNPVNAVETRLVAEVTSSAKEVEIESLVGSKRKQPEPTTIIEET